MEWTPRGEFHVRFIQVAISYGERNQISVLTKEDTGTNNVWTRARIFKEINLFCGHKCDADIRQFFIFTWVPTTWVSREMFLNRIVPRKNTVRATTAASVTYFLLESLSRLTQTSPILLCRPRVNTLPSRNAAALTICFSCRMSSSSFCSLLTRTCQLTAVQ